MKFQEPLPKIKIENKTEKLKIKEGVDFVFEQNPELANIGTKEQYSEYLNTIFPNSKEKNILYHGSINTFENFKKPKELNKLSLQNGIFFTNDRESKEGARWYSELRWGKLDSSKIYPVLLNVSNLKKVEREKVELVSDSDIELYEKEGVDSVFSEWEGDGGRNVHELSVFSPNQIHILGSKENMEGFKDFVSKD